VGAASPCQGVLTTAVMRAFTKCDRKRRKPLGSNLVPEPQIGSPPIGYCMLRTLATSLPSPFGFLPNGVGHAVLPLGLWRRQDPPFYGTTRYIQYESAE